MQKLEPKTQKEKTTQLVIGSALLVSGLLLGKVLGLIAFILILVGLAIAGNALFAKTKH